MRAKRKKFIILFLGVLGLIVLMAIVFYLIIKPKTEISSDLSDRAQEFIEREEGSIENADLTPEEKRVNEKITVKGCYSFTFPFNFNSSREQEECAWIYNSTDPVGRVVVRSREINVNSLSDVPDVNLRETRSEEYEKSVETINGAEYYLFEKTAGGYELSAFSLIGDEVLSVSLTSQINESMKEEVIEMLSSMEVY